MGQGETPVGGQGEGRAEAAAAAAPVRQVGLANQFVDSSQSNWRTLGLKRRRGALQPTGASAAGVQRGLCVQRSLVSSNSVRDL